MKKRGSSLYFGEEWPLLLAICLGAPSLIAVILNSAALNARAGDLTLFWFALACAFIGIVSLFVAKLPLYRQGRYFTFGPRALPARRRSLCWIAYVFIVTGVLVMLFLIAVLR